MTIEDENRLPAEGKYDDRDFRAEDAEEEKTARIFAWIDKVRAKGLTEEDASNSLLQAVWQNLENGYDALNNASHFNNILNDTEREKRVRQAIETIEKEKTPAKE